MEPWSQQVRKPWRLPGNALAALVAAALLTLCLEPRELFSAGFQMSYAVVSSLVVMCSPVARRWQESRQPWRDLPQAAWGWPRRLIVWLWQLLTGALATSWVALLMVHGTELPGVYFRAQFLSPWMAPAALAALVAVILAGASTRWSSRWGAMLWPPLAVMLILFFGVKFG